jgi:hypothetical protein
VAGELDQFQVICIGEAGINKAFHQSSRFSHAASQKNGHARLDMPQDLLGRDNQIFPSRIINSAHLLFSLLGFGSGREAPTNCFAKFKFIL